MIVQGLSTRSYCKSSVVLTGLIWRPDVRLVDTGNEVSVPLSPGRGARGIRRGTTLLLSLAHDHRCRPLPRALGSLSMWHVVEPSPAVCHSREVEAVRHGAQAVWTRYAGSERTIAADSSPEDRRGLRQVLSHWQCCNVGLALQSALVQQRGGLRRGPHHRHSDQLHQRG